MYPKSANSEGGGSCKGSNKSVPIQKKSLSALSRTCPFLKWSRAWIGDDPHKCIREGNYSISGAGLNYPRIAHSTRPEGSKTSDPSEPPAWGAKHGNNNRKSFHRVKWSVPQHFTWFSYIGAKVKPPPTITIDTWEGETRVEHESVHCPRHRLVTYWSYIIRICPEWFLVDRWVSLIWK